MPIWLDSLLPSKPGNSTSLPNGAAYLSAEALHVSGVLAAVTCGLMLGRQQHAEFTARTPP